MAEKKLTFEQSMERLDEIVSLLEENEKPLDETIALFEEDPSYEQSAEMIKECHYLSALILMDEKQYNAATLKFADLGQYKDSATMIRNALTSQAFL